LDGSKIETFRNIYMSKQKEKVKSVGKTPITYYGGKQTMLKHILPLVPEHTLYTEVFAGGAALFFAKKRAEVEVINDLNGELINFYRVVVSKYDKLKAKVELLLHSRAQHQLAFWIYKNPWHFSDVDRAWALFALSKMSFAGQLENTFGFDKGMSRHPKKIFYAKDAFNLSLKERLECVTIEQDDAMKVLKRFDTPEAFHFIDPPYVGTNMGHYKDSFNNEDLKNLLELCTALKGKFMLTMFPNEVIQGYVDKHGWTIHSVERQISACKAASRRRQEEWMVTNY
jgi:DNA adenine methylase